MATKLGIYNDALRLLGQRVLKTDTEDREPRYDLDDLWDEGGVDYCLETVKPRFATKMVLSTGVTPTLVTEYTYEHTLPADFNALVDLYKDGKLEQEITKFYREGDKLLNDYQTAYVRYVLDFATVGLTNMPESFARVVSAFFARELAWKYDPDAQEKTQAELTARIELSDSIEQQNEGERGSLTQTVLTTPWLTIYNDALLILGREPLASVTDDSIAKNRLDYARSADLVESVLEDTSWGFGIESKQIFYDPGIEPEWGYDFACQLPPDIHRFNGVWADEFYQMPIKLYTQEQGYIFSSYQIIYIEYVSKDFLTDPSLWPSYFRRLIAARLAKDAGPSIDGADVNNARTEYKDRRREAMSTDAVQQPPHILARGSWSRTRYEPANRRNRP